MPGIEQFITLTAASDKTVDTTGFGSYALIGDAKYDTAAWTSFVVSLYVASNSGTSPTLDIKIQHSAVDPDNVDFDPWEDLKSFTQVTTANGISTITLPDSTIKGWGRYIRIMATVGGTSPVYVIRVDVSPRG